MEELDYFGVIRPKVSSNLQQLAHWRSAKMAPRYRYIFSAQRQAHHLAMMLDVVPSWPFGELTLEDVLDLASEIVGHPKTFSTGLIVRIRYALDNDRSKADAAQA